MCFAVRVWSSSKSKKIKDADGAINFHSFKAHIACLSLSFTAIILIGVRGTSSCSFTKSRVQQMCNYTTLHTARLLKHFFFVDQTLRRCTQMRIVLTLSVALSLSVHIGTMQDRIIRPHICTTETSDIYSDINCQSGEGFCAPLVSSYISHAHRGRTR